jgi:prevent-host-death family protein
MRNVTATEASRSFAALLDSVEGGETVVVTRGGRRVATITPAVAANGHHLLDILGQQADDTFQSDVLAVREATETRDSSWPDA